MNLVEDYGWPAIQSDVYLLRLRKFLLDDTAYEDFKRDETYMNVLGYSLSHLIADLSVQWEYIKTVYP